MLPVLAGAAGFLGFRLYEFIREGTYFELREIRVSGDTRGERMQILECLNVRVGDNLLLLSKEQVRRHAEAHPWVRHARVGKQLPNTLWIEILERTPVALLNNDRDRILFGLDEEGYVLPPLPGEEIAAKQYPVVTGVPANRCFPGNLIEFPALEPVPAAVRALRETIWLKEAVSEIHWDPDMGYVLYPDSGSRRLIVGKERVRERMAILDQAWGFFRSEGIETRYVDARFESQGAVFHAETLSEQQWLAYVGNEKAMPGPVAAALAEISE